MLFDSVAFKNVISLGHILDEKGQKMSTSKGNVVDPWEVLEEAGADAFRWYLYTSGPPGEPRRFSKNLVSEVIKKFWSTLWNTYSFFVTYANIDSWTPAMKAPPPADRELLDRWVLAELHSLIKTVTDAANDSTTDGYPLLVEAFLRACQGDGPPPLAPEDGLWVAECTQGAYRAAETGRIQQVTIPAE